MVGIREAFGDSTSLQMLTATCVNPDEAEAMHDRQQAEAEIARQAQDSSPFGASARREAV